MDELNDLSALVVDPKADMRSMLRTMLAQCGINDVRMAATAAAAIRHVEERRFDVILCEYHLGDGQDGQHFLEDLRNHQLIPLTTLFIMITGESSYERVVSAVELAPNDYILKPFAADQLHQRIERAIAQREALRPVHSLIEIGALEEAVGMCREKQVHTPAYALDFMRLEAQLLIALGLPEAAEAVYMKVLEARAAPWAKLGLARALFMRKELAEAEAQLRQLVDENPQYLDAYDWLSRVEDAAGRKHDALRTLERAVGLSPHTVRRLKKLGDIALETGELETAGRAWSEVVRKGKYSDFRDPEDHVKLVKVFVETGDLGKAETAIRDLDRSMQGLEKTELCSAISSALVATRAGDGARAAAALDRAVEATQKQVGVSDATMIDLARACLENRRDEAAESIIGGVMRNTDSEEALSRAAAVFADAGRADLGERLINQAREEVGDLVRSGVERAGAGDFEGSAELMLRAAQKMPGNSRVGLNAALAILKLIEHRGWNEELAAQARRLIDRVIRRDPGNARIAPLQAYYQGMLARYGIKPIRR